MEVKDFHRLLVERDELHEQADAVTARIHEMLTPYVALLRSDGKTTHLKYERLGHVYPTGSGDSYNVAVEESYDGSYDGTVTLTTAQLSMSVEEFQAQIAGECERRREAERERSEAKERKLLEDLKSKYEPA